MATIAQCLKPLKAIRSETGKIAILDRSAFIEYENCGRLVNSAILSKHPWLKERFNDGLSRIFDVPCGHCINCRLNYAKKWSQRCLLECKSWSENFFITLTYDEENLPLNHDYSTGEVLSMTLVPQDVTAFLKRLREYYNREFNHQGIRFYMAGEYGDNTFRPHYHLIMFNLPIFDLEFYSNSPLGDVYYNSSTISKLWGKGHCVIGEVTAESAAYVARYCQKKATKNIDYDALGIAKEYTNMSRKPGIALPYLQEHFAEIYMDDVIYLPNGQLCQPMRYFDEKAKGLGVDIDYIKKKRQDISFVMNSQNVAEVSKDYYNYLDDLEKSFENRSKLLARRL